MKIKRRKPELQKLTARQRAILLTGDGQGLAGRGFIDEAETLASWAYHRDELLQECGTARPHAYVVYELSPDSPAWIDAVFWLFRSGALGNEDRVRELERNETLSPDQPADLHAAFLKPENIMAMGRSFQELEAMLREFGHAEAFHRWRQRESLAQKYATIGRNLRNLLRAAVIPYTLEPRQS
jgi:hypothetical protein